MGFWSRLLGRDERKDGLDSSLKLFRELYGSPPSRSGEEVNWKTSLGVATVLAVCRVIAEGVAQVPFRVYRDTGTGGRVPAADHPLTPVLHRRPNPWQTSFEFRETLLFHTILTNNAFAFINRVGAGREVRELIPIEPGRVEIKQNPNLSLTYRIRPKDGEGGAPVTVGQDAIWHLRGPSWNSWQGMDATRLAREAIGLSMALEHSHADFHKNGAKTSGLFSVKEKLSPEKYNMLRAYFEKELAQSSSYRPLILDQDGSFTPFTMTGVDSQHLETRKHQIEEICRAFRVMPIMVGHADKTATYASAEQMFLAHVVHTLAPWYERIEQSADVNLLSDGERAGGLYTKFTPNALMRGAAKDRADFYTKALGSGGAKGWMTQNEVRALEELDRDDTPEADELPQAAAASAAASPPDASEPPEPET